MAKVNEQPMINGQHTSSPRDQFACLSLSASLGPLSDPLLVCLIVPQNCEGSTSINQRKDKHIYIKWKQEGSTLMLIKRQKDKHISNISNIYQTYLYQMKARESRPRKGSDWWWL